MSTTLDPHTERRLLRLVDLGERLFILLFFASLVVRVGRSLDLRPYNILVLVAEGLVAFFFIIRRDPSAVTVRPVDWLVALSGSIIGMFVDAGGDPLLRTEVGSTFMVAGLLLSIWAKLNLRRSFGAAAAHRGLVNSGPYRIVRHPMYAGYTLVYVGFFLNNPLIWNLTLYVIGIALFVLRILAEEKLLGEDPEYSAYMGRVHYRFIPGVF
jgi:protein-S-isoprenylcysteine O-methyltransferase Ste14